MDKQTFLSEYNISENDLIAANITWEELALIKEEYRKLEGTLRELGKSFIDEYLYDIETAGIHSYRYRTKRVEHLLEKVVRKKKENPEKFARLDHTNYYKFVTDLIGIRVFFLYRECSFAYFCTPAGRSVPTSRQKKKSSKTRYSKSIAGPISN